MEAALARLQGAEKTVKTLRFSFTQKTLVKVTGEEQSAEGKAAFRRPDRFRVEHAGPRAMTAVSDGTTLWIYNAVRHQVLRDKWENWSKSAGFPQGLTPFQEGASDLRKKYNVDWEGKSGQADVLRFTPKDPGSWPYTLRVWVDQASGLPLRTELESQSLKTVTEVGNLEVNPDIPDDVFHFKPPAGADVFGPSGEGSPK